jgi:hypothetical protein
MFNLLLEAYNTWLGLYTPPFINCIKNGGRLCTNLYWAKYSISALAIHFLQSLALHHVGNQINYQHSAHLLLY